MDDLKLGGCETDLEGNPELGALVVHGGFRMANGPGPFRLVEKRPF